MNLHDYLQLPGSLSVSQLRAEIGAKSDAQIRQWEHGYAGRRPGLDYQVAIERATTGLVPVEEWGVGKWMRVVDEGWPHAGGRPVWDSARIDAAAEA